MYVQDAAVYFGPADGIWGALLDETLSQRFLQLCIIKMLLMVSGAFLVDEMLQPVYVQDANVYFGPADGIWDAPVG